MNEKLSSYRFDFTDVPLHLSAPLELLYQKYEKTPSGDNGKSLRFSVVLPKGWIAQSPIGDSSDTFPKSRIIGLFAEPPKQGSGQIVIVTTKLEYEIDTLQWVNYFCKMYGWNPLDLKKWQTSIKGMVYDIMAIRKNGFHIEVLRGMAFLEKQRIFFIFGISPSQEYNLHKNSFYICCTTFTIIESFQKCIGITEELQMWEKENKNLSFSIPKSLDDLKELGFQSNGLNIFVCGKAFTTSFSLEGWINGSNYLDPQAQHIKGYLGTGIVYGTLDKTKVQVKIGIKKLKNLLCYILLITLMEDDQNIKNKMRATEVFNLIRISVTDNPKKKWERLVYTLATSIEQSQNKLQYGLRYLGWILLYQLHFDNCSDPRFPTKDLLPNSKWIIDDDVTCCMNCKRNFSMRKRKHHCRSCGLIFCSECTSYKIKLTLFGTSEINKVCKNCSVLYGNENQEESKNKNKNKKIESKSKSKSNEFDNLLESEIRSTEKSPQKIKKNKKNKKKKSIDDLHFWFNWKEGSFIEIEVSKDQQKIEKKNYVHTLKIKNIFSYLLQVKEKNSENIMDVKFQKFDGTNIFEPISQLNILIGTEIIKLKNKWYKCLVWKSEINNKKKITKYQWFSPLFKLPIKMMTIDNKLGDYSESLIQDFQSIIEIKQKKIQCVHYSGTIVSGNKQKKHAMWVSENIPGGIVKIREECNGAIEIIQVVDFKGSKIDMLK
ncbi:arrestin domain-containing protein d [Anaeramoeba flamelloides]|uniref:Arrestin domain-containing protein d n=1 Tax=Anaeramoeba flamelloides TaxID=1746091 RepID=A0ABQ8XDW4_9EUKA|nr:arrestin domain-containing protein d [Anaeramoeba flamelloides]